MVGGETMTGKEVIEGIKNLEETRARNSMGCSENWYNFFYAMKETFTEEEILAMSDKELENLEKLAENIQEGLY